MYSLHTRWIPPGCSMRDVRAFLSKLQSIRAADEQACCDFLGILRNDMGTWESGVWKLLCKLVQLHTNRDRAGSQDELVSMMERIHLENETQHPETLLTYPSSNVEWKKQDRMDFFSRGFYDIAYAFLLCCTHARISGEEDMGQLVLEHLHRVHVAKKLNRFLDDKLCKYIEKQPSPQLSEITSGANFFHETHIASFVSLMLRVTEIERPFRNNWTVLVHSDPPVFVQSLLGLSSRFLSGLKQKYEDLSPAITKILVIFRVLDWETEAGAEPFHDPRDRPRTLCVLISRKTEHTAPFITMLNLRWTQKTSFNTNQKYIQLMHEIGKAVNFMPINIVLPPQACRYVHDLAKRQTPLNYSNVVYFDSSFQCLPSCGHIIPKNQSLQLRDFHRVHFVTHILTAAYGPEIFEWGTEFVHDDPHHRWLSLFEPVLCAMVCISEDIRVSTAFYPQMLEAVDHVNLELGAAILAGDTLLSPVMVDILLTRVCESASTDHFYVLDGNSNPPPNTYTWGLSVGHDGRHSITRMSLVLDHGNTPMFVWKNDRYPYDMPENPTAESSRRLLAHLKKIENNAKMGKRRDCLDEDDQHPRKRRQ